MREKNFVSFDLVGQLLELLFSFRGLYKHPLLGNGDKKKYQKKKK